MKKKQIFWMLLCISLLVLAWMIRAAACSTEAKATEPTATASSPSITFELLPTSPPIPITAPTTEPPQETKKPSPKREGEVLFGLKIHGETISVAPNVEEDTLEEMPGWLTTSAMPGESGMCVIYGHRNRDHLKVLKNIEIGDPITAVLRDGTEHTYTVTDIQIHESTDTLRLPTIDGNSIVLVTCYPFRYTGHAPGKYVVVGKIG